MDGDGTLVSVPRSGPSPGRWRIPGGSWGRPGGPRSAWATDPSWEPWSFPFSNRKPRRKGPGSTPSPRQTSPDNRHARNIFQNHPFLKKCVSYLWREETPLRPAGTASVSLQRQLYNKHLYGDESGKDEPVLFGQCLSDGTPCVSVDNCKCNVLTSQKVHQKALYWHHVNHMERSIHQNLFTSDNTVISTERSK